MSIFQNSKVLDCLKGLVGFREDGEPCTVPLKDTVYSSSSGLYYNDSFALVTLNNILNTFIGVELKKYPLWDVSTVYSLGDIVTYNNESYKALTANTGSQPDISTLDWTLHLAFSDYLETKINAFSLDLINRIYSSKIAAKINKTPLKDGALFFAKGNPTDKIAKDGRFMGFAFSAEYSKNLCMNIHKLGIHTDEVQTDFNFYLYHSTQEEPLGVYTFDLTKPGSYEWLDLQSKIQMFWDTDEHDPGVFFIGYYEDDLLGQVYNKSQNFTPGCTSCSDRRDYRFQESYQPYAIITPIRVKREDLNGTNLFNTSNIENCNYTNNGLNLVISVSCDVTDVLCRHVETLAYPLQKYIGYKFLELMAYSTRLNRTKSQVEELARFALSEKDTKEDIERIIKEVSINFSDMGAPCIPCEKRKGIRINTAL
jgi:hypothetical protein